MSDAELQRLDNSVSCCVDVDWMEICNKPAHWQLVYPYSVAYPLCMAHIRSMAAMNSDNEAVLQPALKEHERRRLFMSVMRMPEMRLLRLALRHLRDDAGIDWRDIQEIQLFTLSDGSWCMDTDKYLVYCLYPQDTELDYEDFSVYWHHVDDDLGCRCWMCEHERFRHSA